MLACPRRKLTRDLDQHSYIYISSLHGRLSDTTSPEFHGQSTLNRLMLVVDGSCKEHNVGSPVDRHSAKCRASRLHSQDNLRSEAFCWGQPGEASRLRSCRALSSCPSAPRCEMSVMSDVIVAIGTPRTANGCKSRGRGHKAGETREGRP